MNHLSRINSGGCTKTSLRDRRTKSRFRWIPQNISNSDKCWESTQFVFFHNCKELNVFSFANVFWIAMYEILRTDYWLNYCAYPAGQPPLSLRKPFLVDFPPSAILNALKVWYLIWDIIGEKFDLRICKKLWPSLELLPDCLLSRHRWGVVKQQQHLWTRFVFSCQTEAVPIEVEVCASLQPLLDCQLTGQGGRGGGVHMQEGAWGGRGVKQVSNLHSPFTCIDTKACIDILNVKSNNWRCNNHNKLLKIC